MYDHHDDAIEARLLRRARKGFALSIAKRAAAETDRARYRAERRERAMRKGYLSAMRGAEAWEA